MGFTLKEEVIVEDNTIEIYLENDFSEYFNSTSELYVEDLAETIADDYTDIDNLVMLSIESSDPKNNYSVILDKDYVETMIDGFISTLETQENYEVCNSFLKLKKQYKTLTDEQ
jgi:hypothetical protein